MPGLQVHIICPQCNQRTVVMVLDKWDIENVTHQCKDGRPTVTFVPGARPVY